MQSFSELSSGQAGVLWSENHGDLFADQIRAALSKSPIQSEGSNAHDWEEQQMQSQCTRAQGSLREQSERCLPEETSSSNLCCVQLNTWALCFADSATERSFVASQNRSQISVRAHKRFSARHLPHFVAPCLLDTQAWVDHSAKKSIGLEES